MVEDNVFSEDVGSLIKKSSVRAVIKDLGGRTDPEFVLALESRVLDIVKKSFERAKYNGRNTVMFKDL